MKWWDVVNLVASILGAAFNSIVLLDKDMPLKPVFALLVFLFVERAVKYWNRLEGRNP